MPKIFTSALLLLFTALSFSQNLPSPTEFLGYNIGTQFTRHHEVVDYFKAVQKALPNKVKLEKYGQTYERRPLYVAYISSEENMKKLETIRNNNLKNTGLVSGTANDSNIAIVWLSYNVHGNEASATEASMLTLYRLLTEKQEWLKNTVIIIDPCINPDGRDRYVNWYNKTASKPYDIDQQASEHNEPWPGGRPNHYLFDLNRDWAWATQIESASRLKIYNKWMPHIHVDFHEQGINEPYYFAPAAEPFHEIITDFQREFQTEIGKNHAKYFDNEGWLFFTRERFDLFYPSYGDTYPTYMGAIGMTYEQAGHGRAGLGILNDEGIVLTLVDRLTHHTVAGLSTVEMASKNAKRLNNEFSAFFDNSNLKYKSYVLDGNPDKIQSLKNLLDKHEITYEEPKNIKVNGYNYQTGKQGNLPLNKNGIVVHTDQSKGKMVKVLFEPNAKLSDSLTYDITAWSLPYAYGLNAIASTTKVPSTSNGVLENNPNQSLPDAYGYVCDWNAMKNAQFLASLLKENFKVRFTERPFKSNGKQFDRGALIITKGDNAHIENTVSKLNKIVEAHGQKLSIITSGFSDKTPDIGSPDIKLVNKQKIAMLSGDGTSSLSYGALWHFFEQQLKYPVTSIHTDDFSNTNLSKYNVLIMPSGYYNSILDKNGIKKLTDWVKTGGKVIAIDRALRSLVGKEGIGLKYKENETEVENTNLIPYAERERQYANNTITGAIFKTDVDNTHPMAFGYGTDYFSLKLGSTAYQLLNNGFNVAHLKNNKVYSGFAGKNALENLNNTLVFGEERMGSGSLIYMVDNPLFRSFWENGKLFLVNAIFFVNNNTFEL